MLKLWGRANSSNVMKVMWLCEELGIAYDRVDVGGAFGRTKEPFYLAMNPNALVPVIEEEDGWTLFESNAILRYLCATRGGAHLAGATPREAADVDRWMDWQQTTLLKPMTTIFFTWVRIPEPERDYAAAAAARDESERCWRMVEARLAGRDYLCGGFSTADIALGVFVHRWFSLPIERAELPNLAAWYARLKTRAPYAKHVAVPMT